MQKRTNSLQQFVALRSALVQERDTLQKRLQEIDLVLNCREVSSSVAPKKAVPRSRRVENSLSLREAVAKAVGKKPLTKQEILTEVEKVGYRFGAKKPIKSLEVFLYTTGKKMLKRVNGKFAAR
jgi:hypothetical protein